jgi:hypothetical protein
MSSESSSGSRMSPTGFPATIVSSVWVFVMIHVCTGFRRTWCFAEFRCQVPLRSQRRADFELRRGRTTVFESAKSRENSAAPLVVTS